MAAKPGEALFMAKRSHLYNSEVAEVVHKQLDHHVGLHWHDYVECELLFSGETEYVINGKPHHLTGACAYIATPKDTHALTLLTDESVEMYSLSFNEAYIDADLLSRLANTEKVAHFDAQEAQKIRMLLTMLEEDYGNLMTMREDVLYMLISTVLICFLRRMETDRINVITPNRLVMQIVSIINARFREKLTIQSIADAIFMTPNYIGERFKEEMGVSINTYLMETRLVYARNLLSTGRFTVKEASYQSGFASTTHFSTSFKKRYGVSPSEHLKLLPAGRSPGAEA